MAVIRIAASPARRPPHAGADETSLMPKKLVRARPLFDPEILRPRAQGLGLEAESA